jgi:hypothetical protein
MNRAVRVQERLKKQISRCDRIGNRCDERKCKRIGQTLEETWLRRI